MERPRFAIGDIIRGRVHGNKGVIREIIGIEEDGHVWRFPDLGETCPNGAENRFYGCWSGDPWHEHGWEKIGHRYGPGTHPADVITMTAEEFDAMGAKAGQPGAYWYSDLDGALKEGRH